MKSPSLNRIWLMLALATLVTGWLGESGWAQRAGAFSVLLMFGLSIVKGRWVVLDFMELREAPPLWRWLVIGWLVLVLGLVLLAYAMGWNPKGGGG